MYDYRCKVLKVIDGDTIDVLVDLGFKVFKKVRVRLHGINCPECRTRDLEEKKAGIAARERLKEIVKECDDELLIKSLDIGKYGRAICILYRDKAKKHVSINKQLVMEGHAVNID